MPNIGTSFTRNFVANNFQKLANLVTLPNIDVESFVYFFLNDHLHIGREGTVTDNFFRKQKSFDQSWVIIKNVVFIIRQQMLSKHWAMDSGTAGIAVVHARGPRFESSHWQLLLNLYLLWTVCGKDENKENEAGNGPFLIEHWAIPGLFLVVSILFTVCKWVLNW